MEGRRRGRAARPAPAVSHRRQLTLAAVSSIRKDVASEESSAPVNFRVKVLPICEFRLSDFFTYPLEALRLEYVARVVVPAATVSLSDAEVVVVSSVLTYR